MLEECTVILWVCISEHRMKLFGLAGELRCFMLSYYPRDFYTFSLENPWILTVEPLALAVLYTRASHK
jgi:hypothetical protein